MGNHQLPFIVSASPNVQGPHISVTGTMGDMPQTMHRPDQSGSTHSLHNVEPLSALSGSILFPQLHLVDDFT